MEGDFNMKKIISLTALIALLSACTDLSRTGATNYNADGFGEEPLVAAPVDAQQSLPFQSARGGRAPVQGPERKPPVNTRRKSGLFHPALR